ncbi:MAG: benzoate/H(+) symporter BenE family transporter [Rhodoferax sp.]|nr:benzoate/H(+) symporter BenE family transporter [Rhodoferax sp.]
MADNASMRFFQDLSPSALTAGFVAVLVGFTSSVAIVFQAALALGATPEMVASWMWALGIGMGLCSLLPSLWWKKPVMVAWSTPGAAVIASAATAGGFTMSEGVGAFMLSAVLIIVVGATGWFERVMNRIPLALASALLAGVLARFGLQGFVAAQTALPLVALMLVTYLLGKRFLPRYAIPLTLLIAVVFAAIRTPFSAAGIHLGWTTPVFVAPTFTWAAFVSMALPLWVVTMASQNLPGVAAIRAAGFADRQAQGGDRGIPISKVITLTGLMTLVLAPFGAFALNLSAITAAICMGPQAHANPARRYTAAATCGAMYVAIGLLGAAITGVLTAFPKELVAAIAGLALLGTIGAAMHAALQDERNREAALITFLVTLSGVVIAGIGSAFWGVVAGALALLVQHVGRAPQAKG